MKNNLPKQLKIKSQILIFLVLSNLLVVGQSEGIKFETYLSWDSALSKAKKDNKFIFIDANTSWCGPCKAMVKNIFHLPAVGKFFNSNFVNLYYQMDSTNDDSNSIKFSFKDAIKIKEENNVVAFPTYLFFNPSGELVHKEIGYLSEKEFIQKAKNALDTNTQYITQIKNFKNGNREAKFLKKLSWLALHAFDYPKVREFSKAYYSTQKHLTDKENQEFILAMTKSLSDTGYKIMLNNYQIFSKTITKARIDKALLDLIENYEIGNNYEVLQNWTENEWKKYNLYLKNTYPSFANQVYYKMKLILAKNKSNLQLQIKYFDELLKLGNKNANELNDFAWQIFTQSEKSNELKKAIEYCKLSFKLSKKPNEQFYDTYSNILYKLGSVKEAIKWQLKAKEIALEKGEPKNWGDEVLLKMRKGEKTW
jgi:thioredoxin-related protein